MGWIATVKQIAPRPATDVLLRGPRPAISSKASCRICSHSGAGGESESKRRSGAK
jgi:hypothetical protein